MSYNLYFTLDYEIHGNGDGNPLYLMVEPTYRLMNMLEQYGQRVTIMADVAEILCFHRHWQQTGRDDFHVAEIEQQLCEALRRGHDVQLHIHSSYFNAQWNGARFDQCIEEYNMAALPYERVRDMVGQCVHYLENLLRPIKSDYQVWLYRAANWSMMPTPTLYKVLTEFGITHDTSVYKGGCQGGNVCYDYRYAHDNLLSYPTSSQDINLFDSNGPIVEMPIYTEMRPFWDFVSPIRIFRMVRAKFHKHKRNESATASAAQQVANKDDNRKLSLRSFFVKSPLKMDFNQVNARGLKRMMKHIMQRATQENLSHIDVVLIGHSKTFVPYNEKTLRPFLEWVEKNQEIQKQ